jgi:hypothetical protein
MKIGGYELSVYNGMVVELERWNSPYPSRKTVRVKYHNSGRERVYSYKELMRIGAAIMSILDSTKKKISFGQRWKGDDWDWVLIVENDRYIVVYESHNPITLNMEELKHNKWYQALSPFLGECGVLGLIALEFDFLIGAEKKLQKSEDQESHELTQSEAS